MQPKINVLLDPAVNFGKVTVSGGYPAGTGNIAVTLIVGDGSKLPNPADPAGSFNLVWFDNSTYSDPADDPKVEIVRCIANVNDTLTLMRAQEGTSASTKNTSGKIYKMILAPTKKTIDDIQTESQSKVDTHSALSTGIHGVGVDTIDGAGARNIAISVHSSVTSNVHGFDALGNAPAQIHGISRHDVTTIDGGAALPIGQLPVHGASKHTGTIGTWANIDKTTSNIADITTKSHTSLTDIGSNTHTQIDTAITASIGHIVANGTSVHSLGTMSTQAASNVSITGGSITSIIDLTVSGNVGIGTTSPSSKFEVDSGVSYMGAKFEFVSPYITRIHFTKQSGFETYLEKDASSGLLKIVNGHTTTPLYIGHSTSPTLCLTAGTAGNVGIGTTNPGYKLSVAGTIESTSGGFRFPDGTTQATTAVAGGFSTISDVLSSRAQDTVYQNTSGKTMFVEVHFINSGVNQGCTAYTGASNPPTVVHHMNGVAGLEWILPFIVLPNHYYKIVKDGGQTLTLQDWYEYT